MLHDLEGIHYIFQLPCFSVAITSESSFCFSNMHLQFLLLFYSQLQWVSRFSIPSTVYEKKSRTAFMQPKKKARWTANSSVQIMMHFPISLQRLFFYKLLSFRLFLLGLWRKEKLILICNSCSSVQAYALKTSQLTTFSSISFQDRTGLGRNCHHHHDKTRKLFPLT